MVFKVGDSSYRETEIKGIASCILYLHWRQAIQFSTHQVKDRDQMVFHAFQDDIKNEQSVEKSLVIVTKTKPPNLFWLAIDLYTSRETRQRSEAESMRCDLLSFRAEIISYAAQSRTLSRLSSPRLTFFISRGTHLLHDTASTPAVQLTSSFERTKRVSLPATI